MPVSGLLAHVPNESPAVVPRLDGWSRATRVSAAGEVRPHANVPGATTVDRHATWHYAIRALTRCRRG
jgi:hypothetical protein